MRVSGFTKSAAKPFVAKADPIGATTLGHFGADSKSFTKAMNNASRVEPTIGNAERPSNLYYKMGNQSMYWYMYHLMDFYKSEVSIFSTICHRVPAEIFRYGLRLEPLFKFKCEDCGHTTKNLVDECSVCHSKRLRGPDPTQLEYFKRPNGKSFLEEANNNGQSLEDVLRQYAESEMPNNQAYTLCVTGDVYDKITGNRLEHYPLEFLNFDPKFVKFLYDDTGVPGTEYGFTMDDRESMITMSKDKEKVQMCNDQGKTIYPAYWKIGNSYGGEGRYRLYTQEEIYQDHWFEQTPIYGRPIWLDVEDDLLTYHYIEKHNLKKYKFGYVRKMVILPGFSNDAVEETVQGITDILAKNDNSIPIVALPPQLPGSAEMRAQTLELGTESSADLLQIKDEIRNRLCAHGGLPDVFAGDVEASGGMNNESQQITIFDRYLLNFYKAIDRQCEWIMSWFPMITDYELIVDRPTRAFTDEKKRIDKVQEAMAMKQLGFDIMYCDGDFHYSSEPIDQTMRKQQAKMGMGNPMAAMMGGGQGGSPEGPPGGGIFPGDGAGPPQKGTARRANEEIDANKNELDQTQRDAKGSVDL